ncbi:MAG: hypothetical protein GX351_11115 [Peptococcaceae bacterium]|nr:hypothetical protein [Peptococcaceae bacterium]
MHTKNGKIESPANYAGLSWRGNLEMRISDLEPDREKICLLCNEEYIFEDLFAKIDNGR